MSCDIVIAPLYEGAHESFVTWSRYIIHFYCTAIEASFYSSIIAVSGCKSQLHGSILSWDRLEFFALPHLGTYYIYHRSRKAHFFKREIVVIFLSISLNRCFGCSKEPFH